MSLLAVALHNPVGVALALVPLLVNLAILAVILRRGVDTRIARVFVMFVVMLVAWQAFDVAIRTAITAQSAATWRDLLRAGQFFAIATGVHFALRFAGHDRVADHVGTYGLLYLPPLAAQALYAAGVIDERLVRVPIWGWIATAADAGPWFDAVTVGFTLMVAAIPAILYAHVWRVRHNPRRFPTAQLIAVGISVPVVIGVVTEVVLPLVLGMRQIPITSTTLSAFSLASAVALQRNRIFEVDTVATARGLIDAVTDALMVCDPDGHVRFANAVAREQFNVGGTGRTEVQAMFRSPREADAFLAGPWTNAIMGARRIGLEMTLLDRNHGPVECLVSLAAVRQSGMVGVMLVAHDISELRGVEAELAVTRERVEEARGTDGPWVAHLADELREPLHGILGAIRTLSDQAELPPDPALLERIDSQGSQLLRLLSDVIDVSSIDAGELSLAFGELDLAAVLKELKPQAKQLTEAHQNRVYVLAPTSVEVRADGARVRQVVMGVLAFVSRLARGRTLTITAARLPLHGAITVSVPDVRLSPAQLTQALDRLPRSGRAKGPRLTLALCRRLCQLMGGDLEAEAGSSGTRFVARLPLVSVS